MFFRMLHYIYFFDTCSCVIVPLEKRYCILLDVLEGNTIIILRSRKLFCRLFVFVVKHIENAELLLMRIVKLIELCQVNAGFTQITTSNK